MFFKLNFGFFNQIIVADNFGSFVTLGIEDQAERIALWDKKKVF